MHRETFFMSSSCCAQTVAVNGFGHVQRTREKGSDSGLHLEGSSNILTNFKFYDIDFEQIGFYL